MQNFCLLKKYCFLLVMFCVCHSIVSYAQKNFGPTLPEPMVFDLVRPLGAEKGEIEFNTLAIFPLRRKGQYNVHWAPEIEWAFADGYGIELELPMVNGQIEAYKLALQGTFKNPGASSFIHGWQWLSEYIVEEQIKEFNLLYIAGKEFSNGYSFLGMMGARHNLYFGDVERRSSSDWDILFNGSFNRKLSETFVLSLEANYGYLIGLGQDLRLTPQIHYRISDFLYVQGGIGYEWYLNERQPIFATRVIFEF